MATTFKVHIQSSTIIKPSYEGATAPPTAAASDTVPLTVFDKFTYDSHVAIIYAYRPPTPPSSTIQEGLQKALSIYPEWAGRLAHDAAGNPVILLNDGGVTFVEATVASSFHNSLMPLKPSPALRSLHPPLDSPSALVQVQVTRFSCGSMVIGFTAHHRVADGQSTCGFLVAWGEACRGLEISHVPFRDRTIFTARDPPIFEFQHRGVEFTDKKPKNPDQPRSDSNIEKDTVVHKVHFTREFLMKLKEKASSPTDGGGRPQHRSTFESVVAHLWRTVTRARGLRGHETTSIRISVNGRRRLQSPKVPDEYFGNLVLWAVPTVKVKDLVQNPLPFAAKVIHDAILKVNDAYFRSFIDFASNKVEEEGLGTTANMDKKFLCPNMDVDSWLRFPFYELDFGKGTPFLFMPSYFPTEGMIFLLPSFIGDGSIDAFVPLFHDNLANFKEMCYSLN